MPTIKVGRSATDTLRWGRERWSDEFMPASDKNLVGNVPTGPEAILVRLPPEAILEIVVDARTGP